MDRYTLNDLMREHAQEGRTAIAEHCSPKLGLLMPSLLYDAATEQSAQYFETLDLLGIDSLHVAAMMDDEEWFEDLWYIKVQKSCCDE